MELEADRREMSLSEYVEEALRLALLDSDARVGAARPESGAAGRPNRLVAAEREAALVNLDDLVGIREGIARRRGLFRPESWELINESREARSRERTDALDARTYQRGRSGAAD